MSSDKLTPDQLAEQAGSMEATKAIDAMRIAETQGERLIIFDDCVQGLAASNGAKAALSGFSCVVVSWLDLAMKK